MPGQSYVISPPCGRKSYCGRKDCRHAAHCESLRECGGRPPPAPAPGLKKPLAREADVVFLYDGSLAGFLCCVHESVYSRTLPRAVFRAEDASPTLFETRQVHTDPDKAERVRLSIPQKLSPRAAELVRAVFLSCLDAKELCLLRFLLLGYRAGPSVLYMAGHPDVAPVLNAERALLGEAHHLKGFARFSDYGGVLAGAISPKNFVLPYIAEHFAMRYPNESFLLYDKTHRAALVHEGRRTLIVPLEGYSFPETDQTEEAYRALWKRFYRIIAIEARTNHSLRRSHMPKRFWADMTEMAE